MPYMYILKCRDGSYYTGSTIDLEKRVEKHQKGKGAKYTRSRLPVELVYHEIFDDWKKAYSREKEIQKWSHQEKEKLVIEK